MQQCAFDFFQLLNFYKGGAYKKFFTAAILATTLGTTLTTLPQLPQSVVAGCLIFMILIEKNVGGTVEAKEGSRYFL